MDISVQELKQKLDRGDRFVFIDVREQYELVDGRLYRRVNPPTIVRLSKPIYEPA